MSDVKRCATCKWWAPCRRWETERDPAFRTDWGDCELVNGFEGEPKAGIAAYYCDSAKLSTAPDFGCVQWEAKP